MNTSLTADHDLSTSLESMHCFLFSTNFHGTALSKPPPYVTHTALLRILSTLQPGWSFKNPVNHCIPLLQTCQWFPTAFIIKPKFLHMSYQALHALAPWPSAFTPAVLLHNSALVTPACLLPTAVSGSFPLPALCTCCVFTGKSLTNHFLYPSGLSLNVTSGESSRQKLALLPSFSAFIVCFWVFIFPIKPFLGRQTGNGSGLRMDVPLKLRMM